MYNIGLLDKLISFALHKLALSICATITLVSFLGELAPDKSDSLKSPAFEVSFSSFSPAFAAMEDEYLFEEEHEPKSLQAGKSNEVFQKETNPRPSSKIHVAKHEFVAAQAGANLNFDGNISFSDIKKVSQKAMFVSQRSNRMASQKQIQSEELKFGALHTVINGPTNKPTPKVVASSKPMVKPQPVPAPPAPNDDELQEHALIDSYKITGNIQLTDGMAFLGSMELAWVVGDTVYGLGDIHTKDAEYEIEVERLIGDLVVSLYDNRDNLIGEGIVDLTLLSTKTASHKQDIEIRPIDWDRAGIVLDVDSIGHPQLKKVPVRDVNIELYAFNEATKTNGSGQFSFPNWKKTNSKSLAIASKEGYWESLFVIDSKKEATIILFDENYMNNFFGFLKDQGIYDVKDRGVVYGSLTGNKDLSGYQVHLEDSKPVYFMGIGLASLRQSATSKNGLFSFVDLDDGEYELFVEKEGEIVDSQIVIVEQGKVTPVVFNLRNVKKHLEFYDPSNPNAQINSVDIGFFDGVRNQKLENNIMATQLRGGSAPSLMDYAGLTEVSRTFISRNKGLQRVPLINDNKLLKLADENGLKIENGLVFGFVTATNPYLVGLAEGDPQQIIYFNESLEQTNPANKAAYGFIMGGFSQGLNSLVVEDFGSGTILNTDLIFSDHQSISIIESQISDL